MNPSISKWFKLSLVAPIILVVALYFATRLYKLTLIPVFVDEAIYIRWAQIMKNEPTLRFLPLQDGKQPLFMWIEMPMFKLFSDPLVAGRFVSVLAGFGTLIGLSALTFTITRSRRASILAALFYTLVPYTLFFDRMALVDSLVSMFGVWSLLLGSLLVRHLRLDLAMLLGFSLGFALLTKSPGFYFLGLQPLLIFLSPQVSSSRLEEVPRRVGGVLLRLIPLWLVTLIIAFGMYNILRLGPSFNLVGARNSDYVFSFAEVLTHPLNPLKGNMEKTFSWIVALLTGPLALLTLGGLFSRRFRLPIIILFVWSFIPLIFQASIAKVYTTRYLLFAIPPLLACAAIFTDQVLSKLKKGAGIAFLVFLTVLILVKIYPLYVDPHQAAIPRDMQYGYFEEWTAGYGQKEVAQYLSQLPADQKVLVVTEGFFGTLPDGLQIYTQHLPNITVIGSAWPVGEIPPQLVSGSIDHTPFLVVNKSRLELAPAQLERLQLIASYDKPTRP
jgi:hypothetical protein